MPEQFALPQGIATPAAATHTGHTPSEHPAPTAQPANTAQPVVTGQPAAGGQSVTPAHSAQTAPSASTTTGAQAPASPKLVSPQRLIDEVMGPGPANGAEALKNAGKTEHFARFAEKERRRATRPGRLHTTDVDESARIAKSQVEAFEDGGVLDEKHGGPRSERVRRHVRQLEGGEPTYTLREAGEITGMGAEAVRRMWLSLGFPTIADENERVFTNLDIMELARCAEVIEEGSLNQVAVNALLRASSHTSDRLLQWQQETLVELAGREYGFTPVEARSWVLDHFMDYERLLQEILTYSWRRQLAGLLRRSEAELSQLETANVDSLELNRAVGFIDLVSFTSRTERLNPGEFMDLIEAFDYTCRDVIVSGGGRVVKTLGDAFLFIADDVVTGANVVCDVVDALGAIPEMPAVRASLTWGPVLARFGDVFGAPVNLASRLADVASPGTILTSKQVAQILQMVAEGQFMAIGVGSPELQGLGEVAVVELRRVAAADEDFADTDFQPHLP
ncbi:adenylate/guanylate cyclase domain-containing protein [Actinobaculum suis]|uniref:adenylate/guanylate cyclase domain-containing protein n=1 Tax=Actinobaculum suis TaxID=1657 RepID=UPI000A41552B|nr:adenylate/guanylate cyclase domain-containing protein [Actinobaculum suis]